MSEKKVYEVVTEYRVTHVTRVLALNEDEAIKAEEHRAKLDDAPYDTAAEPRDMRWDSTDEVGLSDDQNSAHHIEV